MRERGANREPIFRRADKSDFKEILRLQRDNLITSLNEGDSTAGFLSVEVTPAHREEIDGWLGIFVTSGKDGLAEYLTAQPLGIQQIISWHFQMGGQNRKARSEGGYP